MDKLFTHIKNEFAESVLLPSNKYIKALEYARKHEAPLRVFVDNPDVAIDTNHIERQIRYAVMGRKNWMFHSTENGARYSGILYSLLLTCQLQGVDPRTYHLPHRYSPAHGHPSGERFLPVDSAK